MDIERFYQVFADVLLPDRVREATSTLRKQYYPHPESLSLLIRFILSKEYSSSLRRLAGTQARSLVPKHWRSLGAGERELFRQQLLKATIDEEERLLSHSFAQVITAIAKIDLEEQQWPGLFPTLFRAGSEEGNPAPRQSSTFIIFTILEAFGSEITHMFREILELLSKTLNDPVSMDVRMNTMLALSKLAMALDTDADDDSLESLRATIPQMALVLKEAVGSEDEERTAQSFEVFQTLLGCDSSVLNKHFGDLVHLMMIVAAEQSFSEDARTQAISFLMQCVRFRKLKVQGLRLGEKITLMCLEIATELTDGTMEEEDANIPRSALGLLDQLASSLPPSQVVVPLLNALGPYVNCSDPDRRQGGLMALSMCVEGAPDFIATQLHEILPLVLRLLEDPKVNVRRAALDAAMRLAEDLAEELGKEHGRLIPALVKGQDVALRNLEGPYDEANLDIIRASCLAIDSLIEGLTSDVVKQYLPELVPRLSRLLSYPSLKIKSAAISALGAAAESGKEAFLPYFQQLMNTLSEYVWIKDSDDEFELRCATCDAMASMALAVGPKPFQRYVQPLMQASDEGLRLKHPKLKESSFLFWSAMVKVYGRDFKTFLPNVVKALYESLNADESEQESDHDEKNADSTDQKIKIVGSLTNEPGESDDMDAFPELEGEEDDDYVDWDDVTAFTAVAQEKEIAVEVIGDILTHATEDFLPYLEDTIQRVLPLVQHPYEGVQRAAVGTLFRAYAAVWDLQEERVTKWEPGLPLKVQPPHQMTRFADIIMTATLAVWQEDEDRATITDINRNVAATLRKCGPALIADQTTLKSVTETLVAIITKKHSCQLDYGDTDGIEDFEELSEYDWLIVDTALDTVIGLALSLGETFGQLWKIFERPIIKYASSSEAVERSTSVGVIAECIRGMKGEITPFTTSLLKLLLHRMSDEDPETKSNAAYAIGLLQEYSNNDQEILGSYNSILAKLEPLLHMNGARAKDNAAGCVSRMIMKHRDRVPVEAVLPALVELLPLKEDFEENEPVYTMILHLYSKGEPTIVNLTPKLVPILAQVMGPPGDQLKEPIREQLIQLIQFLHGKQPSLIRNHESLNAVVIQ